MFNWITFVKLKGKENKKVDWFEKKNLETFPVGGMDKFCHGDEWYKKLIMIWDGFHLGVVGMCCPFLFNKLKWD